jgi:hypothetical protein
VKLVPTVVILVAGSFFARAAVAQDEAPRIYECKDADGNVAYQDDPCPPAPPPKAKPKAAASGKEGVALKAAAKSAKLAKPPKVAPKPTETAKLTVTTKAPVEAKSPAEEKPSRASLPWAAVLPAAPPLPQRSLSSPEVDARWTSPQRSLQTFVGAVKSGDRDLVLSCLSSQALADLGPDADDLPLGRLQATVGAFTSYVVEGDVGPYWSVRALRAGARPKWIFLERTGYGEWKVGAF